MLKQLSSSLLFLACTTYVYTTQTPIKDKKSQKSQHITNKHNPKKTLDRFIKRFKGDYGRVLRNLVNQEEIDALILFLNQNKDEITKYINSQGKTTGDTALHHAVRKKNESITQLLILNRADVTLQNNLKETPCDIVSKKDYDNKHIRDLCNQYSITTNIISDNYGFCITIPFRHPHLLEPLSKYPKKNPTILLIGPGAFFTEKIFGNDKNTYLSKLNNTSPQLAETLALFPNAKKIDIIDINSKMFDIVENTIQQLPHYEKEWDTLLNPIKITQLIPYQKRLKNVFLNMKKNTNLLAKKNIKSIVNFTNNNLLHHQYPFKHYDIILALNVLIPQYLGKKEENHKKIIPSLLQALKPQGFLYIDHNSLGHLIHKNIKQLKKKEVMCIIEKFTQKNNCILIKNELITESNENNNVNHKDKQNTNNSYTPQIKYAITTPLIIWAVQTLG